MIQALSQMNIFAIFIFFKFNCHSNFSLIPVVLKWPTSYAHVRISLEFPLYIDRHQQEYSYLMMVNHLFRHISKKTSKLRVLCEGNKPVTGEFLTQIASNAENVSIWWRHHDRKKEYNVDVKFDPHPYKPQVGLVSMVAVEICHYQLVPEVHFLLW